MHRLDLPAGSTSPMRARRFVRALLTDWGVDRQVRVDAELLITELVTNAVIHARSAVGVELHREGGALHFKVEDRGGGRLRPRTPGPDEATGRGLLILDRLASKWEVEDQDNAGKAVHFWLDESPAARRASV